MNTDVDTKATRDQDDPYAAYRDDDEARFYRLMHRLLSEELSAIMGALGDPPDLNNLDGDF